MDLMKNLNQDTNPWLCRGDFNAIVGSHEKFGGDQRDREEIDGLRVAIDACGLQYLGYNGHTYTWSNNRRDESNIQKRLDRFLVNSAMYLFAWNNVNHLPERKYDHLPIIATCKKDLATATAAPKRERPCCFEKVRTKEDDCESNVLGLWNYCLHLHVGDKLKNCCRDLKDVYGANTKALR